MFVSYKLLAYLGTQALKIKTQFKLVISLCNITYFIALNYFKLHVQSLDYVLQHVCKVLNAHIFVNTSVQNQNTQVWFT
jgi:hypothetical protein